MRPRLTLLDPAGPAPEAAITVVPSPGHTPGHVAFIVRSGTSALLVAGDTLASPALVSDPRYGSIFDTDPQQAVEARRQIIRRAADERLRTFAFHMPWPGIGFVARNADGSFEWVPEAWQW